MPNPADAIARRDEMLELLYWLEGEGFKGSMTLSGIARFLAKPEAEADETLRLLGERGDVICEADEYRLTGDGRREAAKRFEDEFRPYLAQGHGECNDPDCDCRAGGPAECRNRVGE